jgi:hypothetical protein
MAQIEGIVRLFLSSFLGLDCIGPSSHMLCACVFVTTVYQKLLSLVVLCSFRPPKVSKKLTFRLLGWLFILFKDTLIMIYLFYYLHKKLNKINSQIRSLKVRNGTWTEGVFYSVLVLLYLFSSSARKSLSWFRAKYNDQE